MGGDDAKLSALVREINGLTAVLRGQAEHDAPVRRKLFDDRFLGRERSLELREISLTAARTTPELYNFPGTVLFADSLSDGDAKIHFDNDLRPGFPYSASTGLMIPYSRFYVTNAAQSGKVLRLWYGFDVGILPPNQDISNIGTVSSIGVVDAVTPPSLATTPYFRDSVSAALGTIVLPASNVNGILVTSLNHWFDASSCRHRVMIKTSAPSAWNDVAAIGISLLTRGAAEVSTRQTPSVAMPFVIPPGYGFYEQASAAGSASGADISLRVL